MQNAIIIHGKANQNKYFDPAFASPSNTSWFPWIQKQLLIHGILAQTPEMPIPWKPDYLTWSEEFEQFNITSQTILIGHSCGAGFLIRWLSEHKNIRVGKVVLIAPWIDPDKSGDTGDFFDFTIDSAFCDRTISTTIFNSTNDFPGAQQSAHIILNSVTNIVIKELYNYGHFTEIIEFPELHELLLGSGQN